MCALAASVFLFIPPIGLVGQSGYLDRMTADFYQSDTDFLGRAATRIIYGVRGISRVVCDVTPMPPGTIEWE